jgi:ankyrin repeat protein
MQFKNSARYWLLAAGVLLTVLTTACSNPSAAKPKDITNDFLAAIDNKDVHMVQQYISMGADLNAKDSAGLTPLHHAVATDDRKIIVVLLDAGSNAALTDADGKTPLELAESEHLVNAAGALR